MSTFGLGPFVVTPAKRHDREALKPLRPTCSKLLFESCNSYNKALELRGIQSSLSINLIPASSTLSQTNPSTSISMQNERGQGVSHATDSQVPGKIQEKVNFVPRAALVVGRNILTACFRLLPSSSTNSLTPSTTLAQTPRPARSATPLVPARSLSPSRRLLPRSSRRSSPRRSTPPSKYSPDGYDTSTELQLS